MSTPSRREVLVSLYRNPGRRASVIADELGCKRRAVNWVLYGDLSAGVEKDDDYQWWPAGFRNSSARQRKTLQLKVTVLASAAEALKEVPVKIDAEGPLDLLLKPPYSPRARCYIFRMKNNRGSRRRPYINLTVGGSSKSGKRKFDHSGGFRPFIVGYEPEERIYVLWDANVYEWGGGFKYNRLCSVGMKTILRAKATGVSKEVRDISKPDIDEVVIACRETKLLAGLKKRQRYTHERIVSG